jgi:hypothetical protein
VLSSSTLAGTNDMYPACYLCPQQMKNWKTCTIMAWTTSLTSSSCTGQCGDFPYNQYQQRFSQHFLHTLFLHQLPHPSVPNKRAECCFTCAKFDDPRRRRSWRHRTPHSAHRSLVLSRTNRWCSIRRQCP